MIPKLNIDRDATLLWAKYEQYKPSSMDLTKEQQAEEFLAGYIEEQQHQARSKQAKQAVRVERLKVTVAS